MIDKPALRARIRAERDRFFANAPRPIPPPAEFRALLTPGLTLASYSPFGSEADPALLVQAALEAGCAIALPHVTTRSAAMRFLAWHPQDDLIPGVFNLRQPHHEAAERTPDIILAPLLAFDARLDRLGQGAGFYDRAFARFRHARRIGLAWDVQRVEALPVDAWDMPLHAVITESGWITAP